MESIMLSSGHVCIKCDPNANDKSSASCQLYLKTKDLFFENIPSIT